MYAALPQRSSLPHGPSPTGPIPGLPNAIADDFTRIYGWVDEDGAAIEVALRNADGVTLGAPPPVPAGADAPGDGPYSWTVDITPRTGTCEIAIRCARTALCSAAPGSTDCADAFPTAEAPRQRNSCGSPWRALARTWPFAGSRTSRWSRLAARSSACCRPCPATTRAFCR